MGTEDAKMALLKPSSKPASQFIEGLQLPAIYSADCVRSALRYKPRPDDVFIVTYPKCGTTWAQHMLILIFRHGVPLESQMQFFANAPFLEMAGNKHIYYLEYILALHNLGIFTLLFMYPKMRSE